MKYIISIQSLVPGDGWHDTAAFRWLADARAYAAKASAEISDSTFPDRRVRVEGGDYSAEYLYGKLVGEHLR